MSVEFVSRQVRVRFAPSPTGYLHVGGARTALFNYLFAKQYQGSFVLRVEDTDKNRHQEESLFPLLEHLKWLGLDWDEGPVLDNKGNLSEKGPYVPYRQKDRLSIYKKQALKLIQQGQAYYCFMTPEEEVMQKAKALKQNQPFRVSSPYRNVPLAEAEEKIKQKIPFCIRFKVPDQQTDRVIMDLVRGKVRFSLENLGDFILIRTDGFPVYNFSCAVDDALMDISHIFRAEEHLSNTLKQQLIQEVLRFEPPKTGHLSLIFGQDRKKLSKRTGAVSVEHYRQEGYLPGALINFLALLGWNPGTERELFSKKELVQHFKIEDLNLSAAVFDEKKLLWLNEQHLKAFSDEELLNNIQPFLKSEFKDRYDELKKLIPTLRSGFKTLKQASGLLEPFLSSSPFNFQESEKSVLNWPKSKILFTKCEDFLQKLSKKFISLEDFKAFQKSMQKEHHLKGKEFFMPLRAAFIGQCEGVEIKIIIQLLDREELIRRIQHSLNEMALFKPT